MKNRNYSIKLSNKKELVSNKEYEKSLLIKKISSLDEDCKKIKETYRIEKINIKIQVILII